MVIIPPRILAKANGIRIIVGDLLCFADVLTATGIINARAPTLFIRPDKIDATLLNVKIWENLFFEYGVISRDIISTTPELCNALLIIKTATTVITAGWPKPKKIWDLSIIIFDWKLNETNSEWVIKSKIKEINDTTSYLHFENVNKENVTHKINNMATWSINKTF